MEFSNSRQSVIKRRGNAGEASNVIIKEEEISSVIVKNANYNCEGFKFHNDVSTVAEEEELYCSPIQNHLSISQAKAAISKLFNYSPEDWHRKSGERSIYGVNEDVDIAFRPTLSNGFSPPEHMEMVKSASSPNIPNSSIYPVHLLPRDVQGHAEMRDMQVLEAPYPHFNDPMFSHDPSGQSESEKIGQGDLNNNAAPGKFKYGKKEHIRVSENSFCYEKSGDLIHPMPLVCCVDGCGKTFSKKVHLTAHIRVHNGERPFGCEWSYCGKSFTRQCELKRHEWVHTKPGRFYCNACGKKFSRADHLKIHKTKCKALQWLNGLK